MPEKNDYIEIKQSAFDSQNRRLTFKTDHRKTGIMTICIEFDEDFIADYFNVPGNDDNYLQKLEIETARSKNFLFRLGLIRIEEKINDDSLTKNIQITSGDMDWAKSIEQRKLVPSSDEV